MPADTLKNFWYWIGRWFCRTVCIAFFDLRVYGRENIPDSGAFLVISNHQSYLDPMFCGVALSRRLFYLARDSLFAGTFFRVLISSIDTIPVKRDSADLSAVRAVIARLRQGHGVCLFPEGTRSVDGKISPFKPGIGLLCRRGKAAVVPMVVDGAFESWPRHKKLFTPGRKVMVCYGKAISPEQVRNMTDRQLADVLTNTLRQMQHDCRTRQGKEPYEY